MISLIRKRLDSNEEGFTLIELLVVVIIIGILAAIAIPTFLRQRERGWEATAESDLRNMVIAMESCATQANGDYTGCDGTADGFNQSTGVTTTPLVAPDGLSWTATSVHTNAPGTTFSYDSSTGLITR